MFDSIPYPIYEFPVLADSLAIPHTSTPVELERIPVSDVHDTLGVLFVIFSLLFLFTAQIIGGQWKTLLAMLDSLWHSKGRQSIFYVATGNEQRSKYVLFLQSLILLSIFIYKSYLIQWIPEMPSTLLTLVVIIGLALLLFLFYCVKWLCYAFVGVVFFPVDKLSQWRTSLFSMVCISGIILFIPMLLFVFVEGLGLFSYYFILLYLAFFGLVVVYKTYELFFPQRDTLLYLFLYLCAQEIIPLFFFYKMVVFLFNFFCKTTALWL